MHYLKRFLLIIFLYLCSSAVLLAQDCPATITPASGLCPGAVLSANTGTGLTYQWNRDGSPLPSETGSTLTANVPGDYTVTVSGSACTPKTSAPVTVASAPVQPDFTINPNSLQCAGTPIGFTIVSPQATEEYVWDFGDGTPATGATISHTYNTTGSGALPVSYQVKVYARNVGGCISATQTKTVNVNPKPAFSAPTDSSAFSVCVPDSVAAISVKASLLNTTPVPNDIVSYVVDFGDGAGPQNFTPAQFTSTVPIRNTVAYDTTGAFTITIRAIGSNGCENVFTKDFEVNRKPYAHFSPDKDRINPAACTPVKVTVDTDSTTGGNLTYEWLVQNNQGQNVGFSDFEYLESTNSTSPQPVFSFKTQGRFTIKMIVSNTCGRDTATSSVLIAYPEVRLNADTTHCGPATINFNGNLVEYDANLGTIIPTSYEWTVTGTTGATFVGGTNLNSRNPQIRFPNPGTYTVTVRVANECGYSDAVEQDMNTATITINQIPAAPTFTKNTAEVCDGATALIRPSGPGTTFSFYEVAAGGTPLKVSARDYTTYAINGNTTFYVATVTAAGCESATRTPFTVSVIPTIAGNTITLANNQKDLCAGDVLGTIAGSTPTGGISAGTFKYTWQRSTTNGTAGFANAPISATPYGKDYTLPSPGTLTTTTWFRRIVENDGSCNKDTSNVVVVNVSPKPGANTISITGGSPATICEGSTVPLITGTATPYNITWQRSTSATTGFTTAPGTSDQPNYQSANLTQGTYYFKRLVKNGSCEVESNVVQVNVTAPLANNTIQGDQDICGTNKVPAALTGSAPTGGGTRTILWERSLTGNANDFTAAQGTNNGQNYSPPALAQTTYFRRVVKSGTCDPSISNVVVITVTPAIANNTISALQTTICQGTAITLTGSAATGGSGTLTTVWESSTASATTGFGTATGSGNQLSFTPATLTRDTWFRRKITSGSCESISSAVLVKVLEPISNNTIQGEQEICAPQSGTISLTGSDAAGGGGTSNLTYIWQRSFSGNTNDFTAAPGTNSSRDYFFTALTQTAYFRRVAQTKTGNCSPSESNIIKVTVVPAVSNNTISALKTTICEGTTTTLSGSDLGLAYQWEVSTTSATAGFIPAPGTNTGASYSSAAITGPTWFRRRIDRGTSCPPSYSNVVRIGVESAPPAPNVEAFLVTTCVGSPATLRVTSTGNTYQWYTSATGGTPVGVGSEFITEPLTAPTSYFVEAVSSAGCASFNRTEVKVNATNAVANAGPDATIIEGQFVALQASGGVSYLWSPAKGLSADNIANPAARPTETTTYTVQITDANGCTALDDVTITVVPRVRVVNTFSPNGDNLNDVWEIENIASYPEVTVEIFNRWGQQVFKSDGYDTPWDGTMNGKPLPLDTYYYIIRLSKDESPLKGSVTIIR